MFKTVGVEVFVCKANGWDVRLVGPQSEVRNLEIEFQKFIAQLRRDFHVVENRSAAESTMKPAD